MRNDKFSLKNHHQPLEVPHNQANAAINEAIRKAQIANLPLAEALNHWPTLISNFGGIFCIGTLLRKKKKCAACCCAQSQNFMSLSIPITW